MHIFSLFSLFESLKNGLAERIIQYANNVNYVGSFIEHMG